MAFDLSNHPRFQTKQELVYRTLREAIMSCRLAPGQRLVIEEIARQLSVSPIPVREALQLLQSERLVENVPHVGATVAPISRDSIAEVFTVMEGLETVATRSAAERATSEQMDELRGLLTAMDTASAEGAHERWADLNSTFHRTISRIAGMPLLHEMTERIMDQWERIRRYYFNGVLVHRIGQAEQEHQQIVLAMEQRNLPRLEEVVRAHNQGALRAYTTYISQPVPEKKADHRDR